MAEREAVIGCLHTHTPLQTSREETVWGVLIFIDFY
jgi:hypothetical protein